MRGGDGSLALPSSDSDARDSGNLFDGMGSASSLASSTSSSIFSANAQAVRSNGHMSSATPLTYPDASPLKSCSPFPSFKSKPDSHQVSSLPSPARSSGVFTNDKTPMHLSDKYAPHLSPTPDRKQARPAPGEAKGYRVVYDPELDKLGSKEDKKSRPKLKLRAFGTEVCADIS